MTVVNINLTDVSGYSPSRGDAVIFEAPQVRGGSKGQVVSTAPVRVELKNGTGTVDLEPGPAIVTIAARAYRGKRTFEGVIPDNGPVTFLRVIEGEFTYQPAILSEVSRLMMAASNAAKNADADATAAKASAAEAKASELNALSHKETAVTSASAAKASESNALSAASAAEDSRDTAAASASAAKASETNAKASETAAKASQAAAATSAANAKASETAAKSSESAATTSAANAKTSETNAAASAASAKTSETNAAASAASAKTSETNAAASAAAAKTSETNAKTSETNAKASQTAAAMSAANAKTSETNAKTSETNAAASASAAKTDADRAKAEADRANTSHTHKTDDVTDAVSTIGGAANANRLVKTGADGQVKLTTANIRESADLVNKAYVDAATTGIASAGHKHTSADITDSQYVASTANAGKLVRVHTDGHIQDDSAPTAANHLANKGYVDTKAPSDHKHVSADITDAISYFGSSAFANKLVRTGSDGHLVDGASPTSDSHLARKGYVDTKVRDAVDTKVRDAHDGASIVPTDGGLQEWAVKAGMETSTSTTGNVGRYYVSKPMSYTISAGEAKFAVDPDIYYYVSFYVRASAANSVMFLELVGSETNSHAVASYSYDNGAVSGETYLLGNYTVPTAWKRLTGRLKFRPGIQSVKFRRFYFNHSNGSVRDAKQYISDIQIVPITPGITSSEIDTSPYADANESTFKVLTTGNDGFLHSRTNPTSTNHVARKGYVDAEVAKKANIGEFPQAQRLSDGVSLDTYTTSGVWIQTGSAAAKYELNYPNTLAGILEVENNGPITLQRYTTYSTGVTYVRSRYNSTWYGWKELTFTSHTHTLANITDLPNVATPANTANSIATRNADGILAVSTPTSNNDAANKAYVDAQITIARNSIPKIEVVTELPYTRDANTIYMVVG